MEPHEPILIQGIADSEELEGAKLLSAASRRTNMRTLGAIWVDFRDKGSDPEAFGFTLAIFRFQLKG